MLIWWRIDEMICPAPYNGTTKKHEGNSNWENQCLLTGKSRETQSVHLKSRSPCQKERYLCSRSITDCNLRNNNNCFLSFSSSKSFPIAITTMCFFLFCFLRVLFYSFCPYLWRCVVAVLILFIVGFVVDIILLQLCCHNKWKSFLIFRVFSACCRRPSVYKLFLSSSYHCQRTESVSYGQKGNALDVCLCFSCISVEIAVVR